MIRLIVLMTCLANPVFAVVEQKPKVLWKVSESLAQPESVYYDSASKAIYVSNIAGGALDKDGQGWISKFGVDGKVIEAKWLNNLNAPKGIRGHQGILYVSDIDRVVAVNVQSKKQEEYPVQDAKFLNDIAVDKIGNVYVSDMVTNTIFRIAKKKVEVFVQGNDLESPNGLLVEGNKLQVAAWGKGMAADFSTQSPGSLYRIDLTTKARQTVTSSAGNLDGLEKSFKGDQGYLVSDWVKGVVYRTGKNGKPRPVLEGLKNPADIGVIEAQKILLVPEMSANTLTAYKL